MMARFRYPQTQYIYHRRTTMHQQPMFLTRTPTPKYPPDQTKSFQQFPRTPPPKFQNLSSEIMPTNTFSPTSCSTNDRNLGNKIESAKDLTKNKNMHSDHKFITSSLRKQGGPIKPCEPPNPNIAAYESDLRTSCPNIFRKFQYSNTLRNTIHGNNSKLGVVATDIKKQEQEQKVNMKKNPTQPKAIWMKKSDHQVDRVCVEKPSFKSLNQIIQMNMERSCKVSKNLINGFAISKELGKGKFGQVLLAKHVETNFIVALKKIVKKKVLEYKMVEQFKREIRLHSSLDHPNIVKFYGYFEDSENIYLILEYISGGTLFDYLGEKDMLTPREAAEYLHDTIEAITYMHDRSIAHRDIKPENIVLTGEKVAKLCDFGWSALIQSSRATYCGTFDYAPPEILERKKYDTAVDIWCIGVLAYEMLTGRVPFEGEKRKEIMSKIISVDKNRIKYPVEIPEDAKDFIEALVQKDPSLRPKSRELLKHAFFRNNLKHKLQKNL